MLAMAACSGGGPEGPPIPEEGVRPRFELDAAPLSFGDVPWPDDLYLDGEGRIAVGRLPAEGRSSVAGYHDALREALGELDGFGVTSPAYFFFDGPLDPTSLPATTADSVREDASTFLMDVDRASPGLFTRVPVEVRWDPERLLLALRPADGHPLVGGRRYAAVVTRSVLDSAGAPVRPAEGFAAVRDAMIRPAGPASARAYDHYAPVIASLAGNGIPRDEIVALAVFRAQTVVEPLREARARVWEGPAPRLGIVDAIPAGAALDARLGQPSVPAAGLDVEGGVLHDHIGWMVHGRFGSPSFILPAEGVRGAFRRSPDGALEPRSTQAVPLTLWLPRQEPPYTGVVLYQHALGTERSEALAVASLLAEAGWAVIAVDAPLHGLRSPDPSADTHNRFTGEPVPDGFGDVDAVRTVRRFAGIGEDRGELVALHPAYYRDALRQAAVDLIAAVRLLREGDWSGLLREVDALGAEPFARTPLVALGRSAGGAAVVMAAAVEPEIGAVELVVPSGSHTRTWTHGPWFHETLLSRLLPVLGQDPGQLDFGADPPRFHPELAIWQTLLDRSDPVAFATELARSPTDILLSMARDDEVVPNVATESLARVVGAASLGGEPRYVSLDHATAPVRKNLRIDGTMVTRALSIFEPATHELLTRRRDELRYAHPLEPPFEPIEPHVVDNPIDPASGQLVHFAESWRNGVAEAVEPGPF